MPHYALTNEFRSEFNFRCIDSIIPAPKSGDTVVPPFSGEEDEGEALSWLNLFTRWALQQGLSADHTLLIASTHINYALIYRPQLPTWTEFIRDFFNFYDVAEGGDLRFAEWYSKKVVKIPITWFSYRELKTATNNFSDHKLVGSSKLGLIFKGVLCDSGRHVAVKRFKEVRAKSLEEVLYEVSLHRSLSTSRSGSTHLLRLIGFSSYEQDPLLVYDYVSGGSLEEHLQGLYGDSLSWDERLSVAIDTADAITQLHYNSKLPIYHRDVKSSNIVLDVNRIAKLADFGIAVAVSHEKQRSPSAGYAKVKGSRGYTDPHYESTGTLTDVADVYSFGVVLMELVTGLTADNPERTETFLPDLVVQMFRLGKLESILDQDMKWDPYACEHCLRTVIVDQVIALAIQCCSADPLRRPKISEVTEQLRDIQLEQKILTMEILPKEVNGRLDESMDRVKFKCSNMSIVVDKKKRSPTCRRSRRRY